MEVQQSSNRLPIFFGWWVLLGIFLIYAAISVAINAFPLLNAELKNIYDWNHEETTRGAAWFYFVVAAVSPLVGALLDRFSSRLILAAGSLIVLACIAYYYFIDSLGELTSIYLIYALGLTAAGQITGLYIITKWFVRKRGLAVGIYLVGSSFGGIIFPSLTGWLIEHYDWQTAVLGLVIVAGLMLSLPFLWIRNQPSDLNLSADGKTSTQENTSESSPNGYFAQSWQSIFLSFQFYLLLVITAALSFCIFSLIQHFRLFFKDLGLDAANSGLIFSAFFAFSIIGKLLFGYLSDLFSKKYILMLAAFCMCLGPLLLLGSLQILWVLYPAILIYGIGYSGTLTMIQMIVADYYQGKYYGKVLGLVTTIDTLAGGLGISILGSLRDQYQSYTHGFQLLFLICLISAIAVYLLRPPKTS